MSEQDSNYECPNCKKLEKQIAQLSAQVKRLTEQLEKVTRAGKRQAAPFRKPKRAKGKKQGRKQGDDYGDQAHREAPKPEQINETYQVPLPECCPACSSTDLMQTDIKQQYQVEIPVEPIYRQFDIEVGCCQDCGQRVQGRHSLQTSGALGAAASQLGPKVHSLIAILNKKLGLSHGKIQSLLNDLFGITICRSQSCKSMLRTANRLTETVEEIQQSVRGSPQVVLDETGWRVDGDNAWLHVLVGSESTYYEVHPNRDCQVAEHVLGKDYRGVMVHDGWSVYDQFKNCEHQTCLAHLMRRAKEMIERAKVGAARFPQQILQLFKDSLAIRNQRDRGEINQQRVSKEFDNLLVRFDKLVLPTKRNEANERLAKHLSKHVDQLFTFLTVPNIDATNWRAEQAIRPAVVNRKVWGGNRTWQGAKAQSTITSVIVTAQQQLKSALQYLVRSITNTKPVPLLS